MEFSAMKVRNAARAVLARAAIASASLLTVGGVAPAHAQSACQPGWMTTFVGQASINGHVLALLLHDDGSGEALYAGGDFTSAGGAALNRVAKWDGSAWSPLGSGFNNTVNSLVVFEGSLYAGGAFTASGSTPIDRLARWNGAAWEPVGGGVTGGLVRALAVFNDGTGDALFVGGGFSSAGGTPDTAHIAKWDGTQWSSLLNGTSLRVNALKVYDDGTGPALYAGGRFSTAGGSPANRVAKWDGSQWSALGSGVTGGSSPWVRTLEVYDDGNGPALYVGGGFASAGGVPGTSCIAKWDGHSWSALATGLTRSGTPSVDALTVFNDGSGDALYAGGFLGFAGALPVNNIARWDGVSWSDLAPGTNNYVQALAGTLPTPDAPGQLFVGGQFTNAGGAASNRIARWVGCAFDAAPTCPGDTNGDGVVNFADLNTVLGTFGQIGDEVPGDLNGDGFVNFNDLNEVLSNFGNTCP